MGGGSAGGEPPSYLELREHLRQALRTIDALEDQLAELRRRLPEAPGGVSLMTCTTCGGDCSDWVQSAVGPLCIVCVEGQAKRRALDALLLAVADIEPERRERVLARCRLHMRGGRGDG